MNIPAIVCVCLHALYSLFGSDARVYKWATRRLPAQIGNIILVFLISDLVYCALVVSLSLRGIQQQFAGGARCVYYFALEDFF